MRAPPSLPCSLVVVVANETYVVLVQECVSRTREQPETAPGKIIYYRFPLSLPSMYIYLALPLTRICLLDKWYCQDDREFLKE